MLKGLLPFPNNDLLLSAGVRAFANRKLPSLGVGSNAPVLDNPNEVAPNPLLLPPNLSLPSPIPSLPPPNPLLTPPPKRLAFDSSPIVLTGDFIYLVWGGPGDGAGFGVLEPYAADTHPDAGRFGAGLFDREAMSTGIACSTSDLTVYEGFFESSLAFNLSKASLTLFKASSAVALKLEPRSNLASRKINIL